MAIHKLAVVTPVADQDAADLGDTVHYAYLVTNIGNVNLTSVAVDDPPSAPSPAPHRRQPGLAPGSSLTCTADTPHTVTQDDLDAGEVTDTATATGSERRAAPAPVRPGDGHDSDRGRRPAGLIVKSGDVSPAADQGAVLVDDTIAYSYVVTNTGNVSLTSVAVNDPTIGPVTCPTPSPPCAGRFGDLHRRHAAPVTQGDVDAGEVTDTATATGTGVRGGAPPPSTRPR